LLELKRQLADFDNHFVVDTSDGLKLRFKRPVLRDDDMAFLGIAPASRHGNRRAERWHFRWVKDPVAADGAGVSYEQTADFVFVDGRLTTLIVPERFFVFFPKSVLLAGLRSMGHASVDRGRRRATAAVRPAGPGETLPALRKAQLVEMLGVPVEVRGSAAAPEWRYAFQAAATAKRTGPIDITFTLDAATGIVRRIQGTLVAGSLEFDYEDRGRPPQERD
jgi:hypothetical protein